MPSDRAVLCKLMVWKGKISDIHILQCKFNTEFFGVFIFNILRHKVLVGWQGSLKKRCFAGMLHQNADCGLLHARDALAPGSAGARAGRR